MMKRTFIQSTVALALYGLLPAAYAVPNWYFTYGAGISRPEVGSRALVDNNSGFDFPNNKDIYTTTKGNVGVLLFEAGKRWTISDKGLKALSLGLQYQYYLPTDIGKNVTQYSDPDFLNYRYSLNLEANIILLNAKVELFSFKNVTPFVNVGAGFLQLIATDYSETAFTGVTARTSPNFQRNANYQMTYQAGAGISWELNQGIFASINYIYMPLTRFETRGGTGAWSNSKLDFGNAYTQSIFLTLTQVLPG